VSLTLARGAQQMAASQVIVRRLNSIENFGSMDVLCSDKTGTLTEGVVVIHSACDVTGRESPSVRFHAWLNATFEAGFVNPIDEAIRRSGQFDAAGYAKVDEVPYDFLRKRLSILVAHNGSHLLITKGALDNVLAVCTTAVGIDGKTVPLAKVRDDIERQHKELGEQGFRQLGVAVRDLGATATAGKEAERDMTLIGSLVLRDPPKSGVRETIDELRRLGVSLKMITGDNCLVAAHVAGEVGLAGDRLLCGGELRQMSPEALRRRVADFDVFAEIEPNQKEQLILALRKAGRVVGYLGDGINDASALHAADVGISVDSAVDVAKEAADIVLLKHSLNVLIDGIREGRTTFANTLKYVFMATSANFGNMFSMAGASLFLPFLPLLPKQILFMNILTDVPEMTIAADNVDDEMIVRPRRWDIRFIRNFMLLFGVLSSLFDYLAFGVLRLVLHAGEKEFRTGWFIESVISAALIVLVVRSRHGLFSSRPGRLLLWSTLAVVAATLMLPLTPLFEPLGFTAVPPLYVVLMGVIVGLYLIAAEFAKKMFYRISGE
jgi:Mg2+-importing ATPase